VKLADLYARPGLTLSVEFFPPKTDKGEENLFHEIEIIKRLNPSFCSVTYGAGGSTREKTVYLVEREKRLGHLVSGIRWGRVSQLTSHGNCALLKTKQNFSSKRFFASNGLLLNLGNH
jgi:hypothetical protein